MAGLSRIVHFRLGCRLFAESRSVGLPYATGRGVCSAGPWRVSKELEQKDTEGRTGQAAI